MPFIRNMLKNNSTKTPIHTEKYRCSVCDVEVQMFIAKIAQEHIKGKRHQKMLKLVKWIELD